MSLRIGDTLLYPSFLLLPVALAFFLLISYRRLHPVVMPGRGDVLITLVLAAIAGFVGAWFHGLLGGEGSPLLTGAAPWQSLGSLGGYWGALLGAMAGASFRRASPVAAADAIVSGILVGGAVARIACLFAGCCPGADAPLPVVHTLLHPWPLYDIAALLLTAAWSSRSERRRPETRDGTALVQFLLLYGAMRFVLEFFRDASTPLGPFTVGQAMAAMQCVAGLVFWRNGTT